MKHANVLGLAAGLFMTTHALALSIPEASIHDPRVRVVEYRRSDVVQLVTTPGVQTHIQVEDGENYITHALGDGKAYVLAIKANHFFLKPTALNANTNLTIVTDRRVYNYRLRFAESLDDSRSIFDLSYRYPDSEEKKARAVLEQAALEKAFKERRGKANTAYSMAGDLALAPVNAWDDQEFTYFKFPANADLPGIYLVDEAGNESIANRVIAGQASDIYVVQKVSPKWMLRLGDQAMVIYNEAYDPTGVANTTGTKSPQVKRVVKGGTL